ncbi:MAG TPA: hypothetical protein VLT45_08360 [Kofleriaceae bacterium]|nr:hypothetical protein [Kofleriaceae bacterium]
MNKIVIAALVLSAACRGHSDRKADKAAVELPVPTKLPPPATGSAAKPAGDHATSIDNEYATLLAMYNAPAGATPCESLYNAVGAEQDAAKKLERESIFSFVAPKPDFMKVCGALPLTAQQCLVPSYQSKHAQECDGVKMPEDEIAKLYKLRKDLEPPKEAGQLPASK